MSAHDVAVAAGAAVGGTVVGVVLWFLGVSTPFAVGAAVLVVAGGVAWAGFAGGEAPVFVRVPPRPRPGTRSDVMQLAWALRGRDGRVSDTGAKRLRGFARDRLALRGIDVDAPADADRVRALIGSDAYATLVDRRRPTLVAVERCLDRLEHVASTGALPAGRGHPTS